MLISYQTLIPENRTSKEIFDGMKKVLTPDAQSTEFRSSQLKKSMGEMSYH